MQLSLADNYFKPVRIPVRNAEEGKWYKAIGTTAQHITLEMAKLLVYESLLTEVKTRPILSRTLARCYPLKRTSAFRQASMKFAPCWANVSDATSITASAWLP